jgi:uracil-DNA glycosylase
MSADPSEFQALLAEVRACRICAEHLPLGPRPILRASQEARLLVIGQAPGTKVHLTGIPWNDASGDRLRQWLAMPRERFYDESLVAIIPSGLCYPGRDAKGGDLPPRRECAPLWHPRLRPFLTKVKLTLLVGGYAHRIGLGQRAGRNVTATVARWRDYLPEFLPLPHPSWRTLAWERRHPWFEAELLPEARRLLSEF